MLGDIHLAAALIAMAAGASALRGRKGSPLHRWGGRVYVASMAVMLLTAMFIFRLFGGFGPFHVMAVISSGTLVGGLLPLYLLRRRPRHVIEHGTWMSWSYIGLWAAAIAEVTTRTIDLPFGAVAAASSLFVVVAGVITMRYLLPQAFGLLDQSR